MTLKKLHRIPKDSQQLTQDLKVDILDQLGLIKGHMHVYICPDNHLYAWLITECTFELNQQVNIIEPGKYKLED